MAEDISALGKLINEPCSSRHLIMSATTPSIMDTRRHQMFPTLEPVEIERVRRFGKVRSYGAGEALARVGQVGLGLTIKRADRRWLTPMRRERWRR
jgi:hypothetical protein